METLATILLAMLSLWHFFLIGPVPDYDLASPP